MKEFDPDQFLFMGGIHAIRALHDDDLEIDSESRKDYLHDAQAAETLSRKLGLTYSILATQRIIQKLSEDTPILRKDIVNLNNELHHILVDEMKYRKFLCIEPDKSLFLNEKNLFGSEVSNAFPSAIVDIEEAGKCLAFERWTAAVFHLMRVMEVGLRVLGNTLKLHESTNRNWETILKKCDEELKKPLANRSPIWRSDDQFFASATAMLRSVKDAWRNPTMHIEKVYTEEQVESIWNAIKGFMRHLATKIKEPYFK